MRIDDVRFGVVDVETTGRSARANRITEVAVVTVSAGEIVGEQSTLVNPGQYISRTIQDLTGITNGMVLDAPSGSEAFPTVRHWLLPSDVIVAHNAQFDSSFLRESFRRHEIDPLEQPTLCTVRLARRVLPGHRGFSLGKLASFLGIRNHARHRALGDARATAKVLITLLELAREQHEVHDLPEVLAMQFRPRRSFHEVPAGLVRMSEEARRLPDTTGVYRFIGRGGKLLYVGKAVRLRSRVATYFQVAGGHSRKNGEMVGRIRSIEYEETPSELSAILLESRLIKELRPKYNVAGKRLRRYAFIKIDRSERWPKPEVTFAVHPDGASYYGPFRNRDEASMLIDVLQRLFPLRECDGDITPDSSIVPCLYHGINRCTAPCAGLESYEGYQQILDRVENVLNGSDEGIRSEIERKMSHAAEVLDFETAALLRDRLDEVERVFVWKQSISESMQHNNLIVLLRESESRVISLFMIVHGRLIAEAKIGARFPRKRITTLLQRALLRLEEVPSLDDPVDIDEVRLIAGYLRRKRSGRVVVPINSEAADASRLVAQIEEGVGRLRPEVNAAKS